MKNISLSRIPTRVFEETEPINIRNLDNSPQSRINNSYTFATIQPGSPQNIRKRIAYDEVKLDTTNLANTKNLHKKNKSNSISATLALAFQAQEQKKSKKKHSRSFIAALLSFSCLRVVVLTIFFANYMKDSSNDFSITQRTIMGSSYCSNPRVLTSINADCSTGTPITFDVFPGTKLGCYCPGSGTIEAGECSSSDCTTINPVSAKEMKSWRGISLCGTFAQVKRAEVCETGYVRCGRNSFFCVEGSSCGISNIIFNMSAAPTAPSSSYVQVVVNSSVSIFYLIDSINDNQLSSFAISHSSPCLTPALFPKRSGFDVSHPLELLERSGCGFYDINYETKIIDSSFENLVYSDNMISASGVPGFQNYISSQPIKLVAMFIPKLQGEGTFETCGNLNTVCTFAPKVETFRKTLGNIQIGLFYVEAFGFLVIIIHIVLSMKSEIYPLKGASFRLSCVIGVWILTFLHIGLMIFTILYSSTALSVNGNSFRKDFQRIAEKGCYVSEPINDAFQKFEGYISSLEKQSLMISCLWVGGLLQGIITLVIHSILNKIEKKVFAKCLIRKVQSALPKTTLVTQQKQSSYKDYNF